MAKSIIKFNVPQCTKMKTIHFHGAAMPLAITSVTVVTYSASDYVTRSLNTSAKQLNSLTGNTVLPGLQRKRPLQGCEKAVSC